MDGQCPFYLPPGFRFHPTDEEIITHYLMKKIADHKFFSLAIGQANFNNCEPWDLPRKGVMGEKEWYFFCQNDRKYPTGMRTNRATKAGYWKTTGKDKEIFKGRGVLGKKKTLVFYKGRAPRGHRTDWVMHEFRLEGKYQDYCNFSKSPQGEWVVCKVYHKTKDAKKNPAQVLAAKMNSSADNMLVENPSMPPLLNSPCSNSSNQGVVRPQWLENKSSKSAIFSPQSYLLGPWLLHQEEEKIRAPFISNEASSAVFKHQIRSLHSSEVQFLDFDSLLNYEFV